MLLAGQYKVNILNTGWFAMDGGAVFGVIPKVLWNKHVDCDNKNRVQMSCNCLLLEKGSQKILIDTGIGTNLQEKLRKIYKVENDIDNLDNSLSNLGITKNDITDVIITHLHFDHSGGMITYHDGISRPTFPNANYYVSKKNYNWAIDPCKIDLASYMKRNFLPLFQSGKLQFLSDQNKFEGIEIIQSNGHTPGLISIVIQDQKQPIFYCSDMIPSSFHIPTPWISSFDLFPLALIKEKDKFLQRAVEENWLIVFPHDPTNKAATIDYGSKYFRLKEVFTTI